jgi:hypothetical protein
MWESRRDFQRVWEGWEAGLMAFHAFHTLSFPWPASAVSNQKMFRSKEALRLPATKQTTPAPQALRLECR